MESGGRGRVLLVEDDPLILTATCFILEEAGFAVAAKASVTAARNAVADGTVFSAAIVDLGLPDADGWSLVGDLRGAAPQLPILISSGRLILDYELRQARHYNASLLQKPYSQSELLKAVHQICGE